MSRDILDNNNNYKEEIPSMLNVLTILTFIYSGLMTIFSTWYIVTVDKRVEEFNDAKKMLENKGQEIPFYDTIQNAITNVIDNGILIQSMEICAAILCTIGAIMMRKSIRAGFYIYGIATIGYIVVGVYILGLGLGIISYGPTSALFLILYSVNIKHLK